MRRQIIIGAVVTVLASALFYVFLVRPVNSKIAAVKKEIEDARTQESQLRLQIRALEDARRSSTEVQARLAKFDLLLPRTSDLPNFIRQLQEAADLSGIDLTSIAPSPPTALATGPGTDPALAGKGVFTINVVLQVGGGFFRIKNFLERLEGLKRVVLVQNLSITPSADEETGLFSLESTVTLQMYVVNPSAPVVTGGTPAPAPTGPGGAAPTPTPTSS